jgi:hypothetical protein
MTVELFAVSIKSCGYHQEIFTSRWFCRIRLHERGSPVNLKNNKLLCEHTYVFHISKAVNPPSTSIVKIIRSSETTCQFLEHAFHTPRYSSQTDPPGITIAGFSCTCHLEFELESIRRSTEIRHLICCLPGLIVVG